MNRRAFVRGLAALLMGVLAPGYSANAGMADRGDTHHGCFGYDAPFTGVHLRLGDRDAESAYGQLLAAIKRSGERVDEIVPYVTGLTTDADAAFEAYAAGWRA